MATMASGMPTQQQMMQHPDIKAGVQYMCCMVPLDERGLPQAQLPAGAVPIGRGQVPTGSAGGSGMVPIGQLPSGIQQLNGNQIAGMNGGNVTITQLPVSGATFGPQGGGNNNMMFNNNGSGMGGQGSRPGRGRSPQGRGRPSGGGPSFGGGDNTFYGQMGNNQGGGMGMGGPGSGMGGGMMGGPGGGKGGGMGGGMMGGKGGPMQSDRDWNGVRRGPSPRARQTPLLFSNVRDGPRGEGAQEERRRLGASSPTGRHRDAASPTTRADGKEVWRPSFERSGSLPRRPPSLDRAGSPTAARPFSKERRQSAERNSGNRSPSRRASQEPRRGKSFGPAARTGGSQPSEFWQHRLASGEVAHVWFIADQESLFQAISVLNCLRQAVVTSWDLQGINLAQGGQLCLAQLAFHDGTNQNCYLFDILQLGDHFQGLMSFLQNPQVSKLVYDANTHSKILAQHFGIAIAGVFHAQAAYEMLASRPSNNLVELLTWCGKAPPLMMHEVKMIGLAPELWSHRPLARDTLAFAVQSICALHSAGYVLWERLCTVGGSQNAHNFLQGSQQKLQQATQQGFSIRQTGIYHDRYDPELDNWLARRHGKVSAALPKLNNMPDARAPVSAVREGDSPRTASWRAAVAQLQEVTRPELGGARQRSSSPTLTRWLERRHNLPETEGEVQPRHINRASSMPPSSELLKAKVEEQVGGAAAMEALRHSLTLEGLAGDGRTWAEILDEEKTLEAEKNSEEELFKTLQNEDRARIAQAEREQKSSKKKTKK